jgi:hypothetical protein
MDSDNSIVAYVQKWHAIWPEQAILDVFAYKQHKHVSQAWVGLLFELQDCAFAIESEVVREQKSLWWAQEFKRMETGLARHPLSMALQAYPADYSRLADAFLSISVQTPIRASNTNALFETLSPFTQAIGLIESQLLDGDESKSENAIAVQLLLMRLPHGLTAFDQALLPMHLLARHQAFSSIQNTTALLNDWLAELDMHLQGAQANNWFRAGQLAFCRRRIKQLKNNGQANIQIAHAWDSWQSVRAHRNHNQ